MEMSTKERILQEALKLFAQNGYMGTSMSDIAKKLDISKAALYKHYTSKQEIFDSILERMNEVERERAKAYEMPEGSFKEMAKDYIDTPVEKIKRYSEAQFRYWTEDAFACAFRKMLTLEQYRSEEMAKLYQAYMGAGPIDYMTALFDEMLKDIKKSLDPRQVALHFYGPIYLMIGMYDGYEKKEELITLVKVHVEAFAKEMFE